MQKRMQPPAVFAVLHFDLFFRTNKYKAFCNVNEKYLLFFGISSYSMCSTRLELDDLCNIYWPRALLHICRDSYAFKPLGTQ